MKDLPDMVAVGGLGKAQLLQALRDAEVQLNAHADTLFKDPRFTTCHMTDTRSIAARSVKELGFKEGATYAQIVARAQAQGLDECPLELGPHLRLTFLSQPEPHDADLVSRGYAPTASLTVASTPLDDSDDTPKGFYLRKVGGELWLRGYRASPCHVWSPGDVLVFQRR